MFKSFKVQTEDSESTYFVRLSTATQSQYIPGRIILVSPAPCASDIDLLLTAPSPEPAGLLASRLALAGESGELLLLFGVAGGDVTLGVAGATYAIMASLSRHFTSSACQSKSHVHVYTTVYLLSVVESEMFDFKFSLCIVKKIDTLELNTSLYFLHQKYLHCFSYWRSLNFIPPPPSPWSQNDKTSNIWDHLTTCFRHYDILAKTRSRMTMANTFTRQIDTASRAHTTSY